MKHCNSDLGIRLHGIEESSSLKSKETKITVYF